MPLTRRSILAGLAKIGGAGAVYEALAAWDFLKPPPALAASLALPSDSGTGKTAVILGAGVSGLCAAYELDRAGYACTILEASRRAGGRSLTLRRGDTLKETNAAAQVCAFDDGLYLNAGPGRIPHHHVHVIDYCRRFGVALQPYIFASRANLVHSGAIGNGRTYTVRRAFYDLQGHVAELLSKCSDKGALDAPLTGIDVEKLRDMLSVFGDLTAKGEGAARTYSYANRSGRAGYESSPGLPGDPGRPLSPIALDELLRSNVWNDFIFRETDFSWQTSLLEPVGGMDNFFKGFLRQPLARESGTIEGLIQYGAQVTALDVREDKVALLAAGDGAPRVIEADYCISTIPMPIFKGLRTNLPDAFMTAARDLPVQAAGKVGWQAPRFWETEDQIYGGISWTTDPITQIWYPSHGYLSAKGTLTGAYMYGSAAERFNALPVGERLRLAKEQGAKLHANYEKYVEHGVAIGWNNMEFERFGWADEGDPKFDANAKTLIAPQGRLHLAGDQLTYWSGWQEGAIIAAWNAVTAIDRHARNAR